jgi:hypothetical protein
MRPNLQATATSSGPRWPGCSTPKGSASDLLAGAYNQGFRDYETTYRGGDTAAEAVAAAASAAAGPGNLESLGRSRISRGLTIFSLDSRLLFSWIFLEFLVRIGTFQWLTGLERRELFSGCSPGNLISINLSKSGSTPFSTDGRSRS